MRPWSLLAQLSIHKREYLYVKSNSAYNWQIKDFLNCALVIKNTNEKKRRKPA